MKYTVPYNFELFYELGGRPDDPPYVDFSTDHRGKTVCRIFVCADCLEWEEFHNQAIIAAKAHTMQKSPMYDNKLIPRDSAPIAGEPHYLLDPKGDCYAVYINAQCPDEDEYQRTKVLAALKIEEIERAKQLYGEPLWRTQVTAEYTRYPAEQNELELEDVLDKYNIKL